MSCACFDKN